MIWTIKTFDQLTLEELYDILRLRVDVFVVEQKCPYPELDGKDREALHVFARDQEGIQAYLRVLRPGVSFSEASLGRVISRRRRQGLGTQLLQRGLLAAEEWLGRGPIRIEAQTYAKAFYEQAGFRQVSEEFLEDGIPHIQMLRP